MEECAQYIQPLDIGLLLKLISLLDWLFIDWEFGYHLRDWDRKNSKDTILSRMKAIQNINTSKNTIGYHWVSSRTMSDTIEAVTETGAKKVHNWVTVSTHKQVKKGGHVPFQYSTQFVSVCFRI